MTASDGFVDPTKPEWYLLRNLIWSDDYAQALLLLEKNPQLIADCNLIGETVLHFLAIENDSEGVAWLFERGANIDSKNKFGEPVIFGVASLGYRDLFLWFVQKGANVHATDNGGANIIGYLQGFDKDDMIEFVRAHISSNGADK